MNIALLSQGLLSRIKARLKSFFAAKKLVLSATSGL